MKKTLTVISLLAGATALQAQGYLNWQSYFTGAENQPGFGITIYGVNPLSPTTQIRGQGTYDIPSGTTSFGEAVPLGGTSTGTGGSGLPSVAGTYNGNLWTVGLYIDTSPTAVLNDVLNGLPLQTSLIASAGGADYAGLWGVQKEGSGGEVVLPLPYSTPFPYGAGVYIMVAAWYNGLGATSYASAFGEDVPNGYSNVSSEFFLSSLTQTPPALVSSGLTSFDLVQIPEPSTLALGVVGLSALVFRRRI